MRLREPYKNIFSWFGVALFYSIPALLILVFGERYILECIIVSVVIYAIVGIAWAGGNNGNS
ncbi:MAG: hypothetical protein IIC75_00865 [Bacteroidetes bacterium]|nr:hypothetical protein [Bacteroidota bacterium]